MEEKTQTAFELIDTNSLIGQAFNLYYEYLAKGKESPTEKIKALQEQVSALEWQNKGRCNSLRTSIGNIAFKGQEELGVGLVGLLFGHRDADLLRNFLVISNATEIIPQDYSISNMAALYEEANEQFVAGNLKLDTSREKSFRSALRKIGAFLAVVGGPEIREQVFIQQEMLNQLGLRDVEFKLSAPLTEELAKMMLAQNQQEIERLFGNLKTTDFDLAADVVNKILRLAEENEELGMLKDAGGLETPPANGSDSNLKTVQARTYQKLSTDLGRQVADKTVTKPVQKEIETPSGKIVKKTIQKPLGEEDHQKLIKQMHKYEYEKQGLPSELGGGQ